MTIPARFDPVLPAHAIEQCVATVVFNQAVPPKIFSGLQESHKVRMLSAGLSEGPKAVGLQFDVLTGKIVPLENGGPLSFVTADRGTTVTITPNQVSILTLRYIRWANFKSAIDELLLQTIIDFCKSVSIVATKLEYRDRFLWSGTWDNFDVMQLLKRDSEFFAAKAAHAAQQWHSHAGWFEFPIKGVQRLVNVNIDVASVNTPNAVGLKPSVGIHTAIQDSVVAIPPNKDPKWVPEADVVQLLTEHHIYLKALLVSIISDEMAKRIGL
jgi:uncharacterized protein (TIGR04255 family)